MITGEAHVAIHRGLTGLLSEGIAGRVSHGTAHLPSSRRYYLTAKGVGRSRRSPGLRHALGLRAGLPGVPGVAHLAHPPDGRGSLHLPPGGVPLPRHRRAAYAGGFPPPGPVRRRYHPARRAQLRRGVPGSGPAPPLPLRPAAGHRGVRVPAPPRHGPGPDPQRLGTEVDDPVLRERQPGRDHVAVESREALEDWNSNAWRYAS